MPSSMSLGAMPARAAGPPAATSTTTSLPGTSVSSAVIPSHPVPEAVEAAGPAGGTVPGRAVAGGRRKGTGVGSPIEISPGSNREVSGAVAAASAAASAAGPSSAKGFVGAHKPAPIMAMIPTALTHDRFIANLLIRVRPRVSLRTEKPQYRRPQNPVRRSSSDCRREVRGPPSDTVFSGSRPLHAVV
jgi:hypothetical protein